MKKRLCVVLAAILLLALLTGCNLQLPAPTPTHSNHDLTHDTPHTHGHSIDIGNPDNQRSTQKLAFVPVMAQTAKAVRIRELTVTATNLSLMVDAATNLVRGEAYTVYFALSDASGKNVVPVAPKEPTSKVYEGTSTFSAVQSTVFTLPEVDPGEYTLMAYVSKTDGTRVSEYVPVVFTEIVEYEAQEGNVVIKTVKGEANRLILVCEHRHDDELAV